VWSLQEHIKSQANAGTTPVIGNFDADALKNGILPKYGPIDTREGQRLAIEGAARRIDLQNRAVPALANEFSVQRNYSPAPSTSCSLHRPKTWMPATSAGMTTW